jgi:Fe-S cluster assembly iron-binding protein IscA
MAPRFVDMKSLLYLSGTELDYKDELMQFQVRVSKPQRQKAPRGCGACLRFHSTKEV